jgi:hypothetical protein
MSSVSQILNRSHERQVSAGNVWTKIRGCLEYAWMGVTFLLFIFLGPFAAIAVVPAVFSLALNNDGVEPEKAVAADKIR